MKRPRRALGLHRHLLAPVLVALAVLAVAAVGAWVQIGERLAMDTVYSVGSTAPADRIDVAASVQRVDAAGRDLVLRVLVTPRGRLGDEAGLSPAQDLALLTSSAVRGDLNYRANSRISSTDLTVTLAGGSITDYPLDSYATTLDFAAQEGGRPVPLHMTLTDNDALFTSTVDTDDTGGVAEFVLRIDRSDSVLIFAMIMMAAMWALAIAVVIGAWFLVTRKRGLTWPALGWMAASLFALAAFRNAAPGSPPIGSLLDYLAFLWVESIIAVCVIVTVVAGAKAETRNEAASP